MKKLFYLLFALPILAFTSCDDDDDLPNVTVGVEIENAVRVDNTLYVVRGDDFEIESINLVDNTSKGAVIGSASYYWDYYLLASTITRPFGMEINTAGVPLGTHLMEIRISIYAVDYSPCEGWLAYKVKVVDDVTQIPTDGDYERNPTLRMTVRNTTSND